MESPWDSKTQTLWRMLPYIPLHDELYQSIYESCLHKKFSGMLDPGGLHYCNRSIAWMEKKLLTISICLMPNFPQSSIM